MKLELFDELAKIKDDQLTGRYYHKSSFFGLVLMVEYKVTEYGVATTKWRAATHDDVKELSI